MFRPNSLKRALKKGLKTNGVFLQMGSPVAAEICAGAGYDCILIDREHGLGDIASAHAEMLAGEAAGATVLMRVPVNDPVPIKLALDQGVEGIMIPALHDGEGARRAAMSCRYPPKGFRGFAASVVRASGYGHRTEDYLRDVEKELLVIGQIESAAGVDNAEAICATDGLDMIFIGPYDLAANVGHLGDPDHKVPRKAIEKVEKLAKKHGKWLGAIPTPARDTASLYKDGYDLVISQCDGVILRLGALADVAQARKAGKRKA